MKTNIRQFKYIFLSIFIISLIAQLMIFSSSSFSNRIFQKMILITIQGVSVIGYTHFHNLYQSDMSIKKTIKYAHLLMFFLYVINLIYVLFLDPDFGRQFMSYTSVEEYMKYNVNLKLFASIQLYITGYQNDYVTLLTLLRNIGGNFLVFMPMAYFLPFVFKRQRKAIWFVITIFFMVFGVELLQVILRIGSGDIDDFVLNVTGAILMYSFLKCCSVERLYKRIGRN